MADIISKYKSGLNSYLCEIRKKNYILLVRIHVKTTSQCFRFQIAKQRERESERRICLSIYDYDAQFICLRTFKRKQVFFVFSDELIERSEQTFCDEKMYCSFRTMWKGIGCNVQGEEDLDKKLRITIELNNWISPFFPITFCLLSGEFGLTKI